VSINRVEVRLLRLGLREPFGAAHGDLAGERPLAVVRVGAGPVEGWGECEALPVAGYTAEWAEGAFHVLADELAPRITGLAPDQDTIREALAPAVGRAPMAVAALEQAVLDLELRRVGRSLADRLGLERRVVPAGAVVGLAPDVDTLLTRVRSLVDEGYRRVKVKIHPGWDEVPLRALRQAFPTLELQADANGSYQPGETGLLERLDALGLTVLEQPFAPGDLTAAARLRERLATPVAADESAATADDIAAVVAAGAADLVVLKPARLGGVEAARAVHDRLRDAGVGLLAGGLVEAGLGRRALVAVAALPGFTVTGDCSPAHRWLAGDPWPPMAMGDGMVAVHDGPGIAPPPDADALERVTVARRVVGSS
jgi:o-succinylbenzoate synthase